MKVYARSAYIDSPPFKSLIASLESYGISDPLTPLFGALDSFSVADRYEYKAGRAKALGLFKTAHYSDMAKMHRDRGLNRLKAVKASIKKAAKAYPTMEKKCGPFKEMKKALDDWEILFKNSLLEMDLAPEEALEVWNQHRSIRKAIDAKGVPGLLKYCSSKLDELTDARNDIEKRGRPGNPIPLIYLLELGILLGFAAGCVINCFIKSGCEWMEEIAQNLECLTLFSMGLSGVFWPAHCAQSSEMGTTQH